MENIYSDESIDICTFSIESDKNNTNTNEDETWMSLRVFHNLTELSFPLEEWKDFLKSMNNYITKHTAIPHREEG